MVVVDAAVSEEGTKNPDCCVLGVCLTVIFSNKMLFDIDPVISRISEQIHVSK